MIMNIVNGMLLHPNDYQQYIYTILDTTNSLFLCVPHFLCLLSVNFAAL